MGGEQGGGQRGGLLSLCLDNPPEIHCSTGSSYHLIDYNILAFVALKIIVCNKEHNHQPALKVGSWSLMCFLTETSSSSTLKPKKDQRAESEEGVLDNIM